MAPGGRLFGNPFFMAKKPTLVEPKEGHADRAHSRLGASGAYRWINCTGSVELSKQFPPRPSGPAAELGTACHELAELCFKEAPAPRYYVGKKKFNGILCTEEMAEGAEMYVHYVRLLQNRLNRYGKSKAAKLLIEERVHLKHLHPDLFGTVDAVVFKQFGELHVIDFKFGMVPVEVVNNPQLMFYALGPLSLGDFESVTLHVIQPRAFHPDGPTRSWETTPAHLLEFGKLLKAKAIETQKKNAPLTPGEWCEYCDAAGGCPALSNRAMEIAKTDFAADMIQLPAAQKLSVAQAKAIISHKKLIIKWLDSIEERLFLAAMAGEKVEGFKVVNGKGARDWKDELEARAFLKKALGEEAFAPRHLLSPYQAEQKLKGTPHADALGDMILSVPGAPQLAPDKDKRKAITKKKFNSSDF